ncbi:MAG: MarR family winged helix-turn-helix transcriptional regulator [Pseudobdellovibrionaceae bacterium]
MKQKNKYTLKDVKVHKQELNLDQPLARFLITLFNEFETELITQLEFNKVTDVTRADMNVLRNIDAQGTTVVEIAKMTGVTKQAISRQVDSLEQKGYIRKKVNPEDKRSSPIGLTKKGEEFVMLAIQIIQGIESSYKRRLGQEAYQDLKKSLAKLL